jgi:hypothetical protein
MEEFLFPPIFLNYERDPVDDTLYNVSVDSCPCLCHSALAKKERRRSGKGLKDLIDENGRQWTEFSFQFYFHFYDEDRCNKFETILLEDHYYHTSLEPKIKYQKLIIDGKRCERNSKDFIPFSYMSGQDLSDSKPMRVEKREILLKYSVSLGAVIRPLSQFYHLTPPFTPSRSNEVTILDQLISSQLDDLSSLLSLFLMMAQELNEIHCQGLCHCHLALDSFLLYSPSGTTGDESMEWGVQMMAHWLYLPCGPRDFSCTPLLSPSHTPVADSFRLIVSHLLTLIPSLFIPYCRIAIVPEHPNRSLSTRENLLGDHPLLDLNEGGQRGCYLASRALLSNLIGML